VVDVFTPTVRSRIMAAVRSRGNLSTEHILASALRKAGVNGWRRHTPIVLADRAGKACHVTPDFVFKRHRVAIFVDGCFWHGCPKHGSTPKTNTDFWRKKLQRNKVRDVFVSRLLRNSDWKVVRLWEHDLRVRVGVCVNRIATAVQKMSVPNVRR